MRSLTASLFTLAVVTLVSLPPASAQDIYTPVSGGNSPQDGFGSYQSSVSQVQTRSVSQVQTAHHRRQADSYPVLFSGPGRGRGGDSFASPQRAVSRVSNNAVSQVSNNHKRAQFWERQADSYPVLFQGPGKGYGGDSFMMPQVAVSGVSENAVSQVSNNRRKLAVRVKGFGGKYDVLRRTGPAGTRKHQRRGMLFGPALDILERVVQTRDDVVKRDGLLGKRLLMGNLLAA